VIYYNPFSSQRLWNRDIFGSATWRHTMPSQLGLLVNVKYAQNHLRYLDPDVLNSAGKLDQQYDQREFFSSMAVTYPIGRSLGLSLAGDLVVNDLRTDHAGFAFPTRYTGLFVFSAKAKLGGFKVHGDLLNTNIYEKVKIGSAAPSRVVWSPAFSVSFTPRNSPFMIRGFYKQIFTNPTFNDLYYTRIGNRNLEPEFATQYDLGLTFSNSGSFSATADVYYNQVRDKIIAIPNKDLFTWTMLNLGEVDIRGLDVGIKYENTFYEQLVGSLSVNYTLQNAVDITDPLSGTYLHQIPYTPRNTAAYNVGFKKSGFGLFYNQIITGGRYYLGQNLPENYVRGFSLSDLTATYENSRASIPYSLSATVNNIFNAPYAFI
ncbi:MAG: TonB-dependent receptor, partial [Sphingobacteriales bacterium]